MKKPVEVKFDEVAYREYSKLKNYVEIQKISKKKPTYGWLLSSINTVIGNIKADPYFGDLIPRKYLSKGVINKYGTDKILRTELVGYWRLLYTLIGDEIKIIAFILEFMDHGKYDKLFGYKKK